MLVLTAYLDKETLQKVSYPSIFFIDVSDGGEENGKILWNISGASIFIGVHGDD